jgi:hypothetical protein
MSLINIQQILQSNPDYTLAVMFEDSNFNVTRYVLYTGVNSIPLPVPSKPYNGEVIRKNFRLEIWNTAVGSVAQTVPLSLITSVLGGQDYRYGNDFQLAGNNGDVVSFQSLYTALTSPPTAGLSARWRYDTGVTLSAVSVTSWASMINSSDLLTYSGTRPKKLSNYILFDSSGMSLTYANLNGGLGYIPHDIWMVLTKDGFKLNGNICTFGADVHIESANSNAADFSVNGWSPDISLGVPNSDFYVVRITDTNAYVYNLLDWTILNQTAGNASVANETVLTLGGAGTFLIKELFFYDSIQAQPIADQVAKYISDTYAAGMMPLPLVFPDSKPINTP